MSKQSPTNLSQTRPDIFNIQVERLLGMVPAAMSRGTISEFEWFIQPSRKEHRANYEPEPPMGVMKALPCWNLHHIIASPTKL